MVSMKKTFNLDPDLIRVQLPGAFAVDRSDHGNELFGVHGFADRVHDLRCVGKYYLGPESIGNIHYP